jgi:hypothetical protein
VLGGGQWWASSRSPAPLTLRRLPGVQTFIRTLSKCQFIIVFIIFVTTTTLSPFHADRPPPDHPPSSTGQGSRYPDGSAIVRRRSRRVSRVLHHRASAISQVTTLDLALQHEYRGKESCDHYVESIIFMGGQAISCVCCLYCEPLVKRVCGP